MRRVVGRSGEAAGMQRNVVPTIIGDGDNVGKARSHTPENLVSRAALR
jgi:hypothetical protein